MKSRIIMFALGLLVLAGARPVEAQFVVIVNAQSSVGAMSVSDLSRVFQKKNHNLPDGSEAVPVDLGKDSPVREAFSQAVLGRGVSQIEAFWQQQIFAGREVPPDTRSTDEEIIAFVAQTPGGIGYVSTQATLGPQVRKVSVQ